METPLNVSWKSPERPLDTRLPAGPRDAGRSTWRLASLYSGPKRQLSTMWTARLDSS